MTQELRSATLHKQAGTLGPEGREQTLERGPQIWAALGSLTQSAGGPGVRHMVSRRPWGRPSDSQQEALLWSTLHEGSQEYFLWCGAGVSLSLFIK